VEQRVAELSDGFVPPSGFVRRLTGVEHRYLMPADWQASDLAVAAARNQRLIDQCDVLVAFWDGSSRGTRATVERALDSGREVHVFMQSA